MKFRDTIFYLSLIPMSLFVVGSIVMGLFNDQVELKWDLYSVIVTFNLTDYRFYFSVGVASLLILAIFYAIMIVYRELSFGRLQTFILGTLAVLLVISLIVNLLLL